MTSYIESQGIKFVKLRFWKQKIKRYISIPFISFEMQTSIE